MNYGGVGSLLLGIWLIAAGAMPLAGLGFPHASTVMEILAIAAGVLIIIGARGAGRRWWW
jgi:hypothetical protein